MGWTVALLVAGTGPITHGRDWIEQRTALDREGSHEADLVMRVVDHEGRAVDAEVSIHRTTPGWGGSTRTLATTRTDTDGNAAFHDISTAYPLSVFIQPPDRLRPVYMAIQSASNATSDLGALGLQPNFVVTGVVSQFGEAPETVRVGRVTLLAKADDRRLATARIEQGVFRLENFDVEPMDIAFNDEPSIRGFDHRVPFAIDPARLRHHIELLIEPRPDGGATLRVQQRDTPPAVETPAKVEPSRRISGRFLSPDGEALHGLNVAARRATAVTGVDGRFTLVVDELPNRVSVWSPSGRFSVATEPDRGWLPEDTKEVLVASFGDPFGIKVPFARRVKVAAVGARPHEISYSWLVGERWQEVGLSVLGLVFEQQPQTLIRAEKPGHLPRLAGYPPRAEHLRFDFSVDEPHRLVVVGRDGPVEGATVDIVQMATTSREHVSINDPRADVLLESVSTDADGRVHLAGDPQAIYVAYVYAAGYEPVRVRLRAGIDSHVELQPRSIRVEFTGLRPDELLRVKQAGRDSLVALHRVVDESSVVVVLSPGTYDASVENANLEIERGLGFEVADKPRRVDMTVDRRPELVLRLPPLPLVPERYLSDEETTAETPPRDRWTIWASRRTPYGRPAGALAVSSRPSLRAREQPLEVHALAEPGGESTRLLRFSGSGRWLVYVAAERRSVDHLFFTEVDLEPGKMPELELPRLDAALDGSMRYEGDLGFNHHGVAGPRMMLIAADGPDAGWNVVNFLPERLAREGPDRGRFVLDYLPAGHYHLVHHLGNGTAWAGRPVALRRGRTAAVRELGTAERGKWTVEVVDREGRPVTNRILRIRDRMHEAWAAYTEIPTTGVYAADPIPIPPAVRLRGRPVVFESIRAGWLELVLNDPAGPARHYYRKAVPGRSYTLVVDD